MVHERRLVQGRELVDAVWDRCELSARETSPPRAGCCPLFFTLGCDPRVGPPADQPGAHRVSDVPLMAKGAALQPEVSRPGCDVGNPSLPYATCPAVKASKTDAALDPLPPARFRRTSALMSQAMMKKL